MAPIWISCRSLLQILSLLYGSFAKETYILIDPTDQSHPIAHMWLRHSTHMNESQHTHEWVMAHMNVSQHTYEWVTAHIWTSRGTHVNESWHTFERILIHILNPARHTRVPCLVWILFENYGDSPEICWTLNIRSFLNIFAGTFVQM